MLDLAVPPVRARALLGICAYVGLLACASSASRPDDVAGGAPAAAARTRSAADGAAPQAALAAFLAGAPEDEVEDVHADLLRRSDGFPSARQCAPCHLQIFEEWSSSAHAYSGISPMFHRFEQALNELAVGTVGAFCVRCHLPVGTAVGQPRHMSIFERATDFERFSDPYVSIEGVTCIACHRVSERYGRVNGQRRIEPGTIFEPMYGARDGASLAELGEKGAELNIALDAAEYEAAGKRRTPGHGSVTNMPALAKSEFCTSCHQVAVHPGIKLEVVWDQYLDSPAHSQGKSCQDCHMSKEPGVAAGYELVPRANVNNNYPVRPEELVEHKNHAFLGPGYSTAHPGIFPHQKAPVTRFAPGGGTGAEITVEEWLTFDWRAGWGEDDFEERLERGEVSATFPPEWSRVEDRLVARDVVSANLKRLEERKAQRKRVMENGSHLDGPFFASTPAVGRKLAFEYVLTNTCDGHNLPSGSLGAQPQVWLNVALVDPDGETVWESGYVDDRGDLADLHSKQVLAGDLAHDSQLFNLQTKFLTTNVKGTDREMYLPVNFDVDQIPFIRPAGVPSTVLNHPPFIRMEQHSIPPLMSEKARYEVPGKLLKEPGTYRLAVRMRSRAEPIYFMEFVGATEEMIRSMNERMIDIHDYTVSFEVK